MKHKRYWPRDPAMRDLLREERRRADERLKREALTELAEMVRDGIVTFAPGGRVDITAAARREYKWSLL